MNRTERMIALLEEKLKPSLLRLEDESSRHAEHIEGSDGTQTHYQLTIEAACFSGVSKVKRHQMIYALLTEEFNTGLHALAIIARAPGEQ